MAVQPDQLESLVAGPVTLPLSVEDYMTLVQAGAFERASGQIELINGRIVQMNPQGPEHADPIDVLTLWSIEQTRRRFTVRVQLPIVLPEHRSVPESDLCWVTPRRYRDRFPHASEVHLLIEISNTSRRFDRGEKMSLYAAAAVAEYWRVDVPSQSVEVHRDPDPEQPIYRNLATFDRTMQVSPQCLPEARLDLSELFPDA